MLCSLSPNLWVCAFLFLLWGLLWTYSLFLHLADIQALESFSRAKKVSQSFLSLALSQPYNTISEGFILTMLPFLLFKWFSGHSLSSAMPVGQHHCGPCHGTLGRGWTCSFTYSSCLCPWGVSRQEYWSGLPFPSPKDVPDPGIEPGSPANNPPPAPTRKTRHIGWFFCTTQPAYPSQYDADVDSRFWMYNQSHNWWCQWYRTRLPIHETCNPRSEDPWRKKWQPTPVFFLENPWIEEPGGLWSIGWQRVRHGWMTACMHNL